MAHGYNCRNCGWPETSHRFKWPIVPPEKDDTPGRSIPGYRYPLNNCPRFVYKEEDKARIPVAQEEVAE